MNVGSMFAWGSLNGKSFNWLGSHGSSCFEVERSAMYQLLGRRYPDTIREQALVREDGE